MLIKSTLAALAMLALAACGQTVSGVSAGIQSSTELNEFFVEDVVQARIMAERTGDELAVLCWSYLEEFAIANAPDGTVEQGEVVGALSAYQKGRNVRRAVVEVTDVSDDFRINCGPMLVDSAGALSRIGVSFPLGVL